MDSTAAVPVCEAADSLRALIAAVDAGDVDGTAVELAFLAGVIVQLERDALSMGRPGDSERPPRRESE